MQWGAADEFVSAPALDDLQCAYGCFRGFMEAEEAASVPVFALLDNEEVGSLTKQGADGTFLADVAERICAAFGKNRAQAMAHSFMVSADNAHAAGIWIGICGELGADVSLTETFLAIGIDELSVSPSSVLPLRSTVRSIDSSARRDEILAELAR